MAIKGREGFGHAVFLILVFVVLLIASILAFMWV